MSSITMSSISAQPVCSFNTSPPIKPSIFLRKQHHKLNSVGAAFGLASKSSFRVSAMAVHKVKLIGPDGKESEFDAPDDTYILDSAEAVGLDLPHSCRAGSCSTCTGLVASGSVDQSEGTALDEEQIEKGYVLLCIAYPKSDCVIYTHKESEVL